MNRYAHVFGSDLRQPLVGGSSPINYVCVITLTCGLNIIINYVKCFVETRIHGALQHHCTKTTQYLEHSKQLQF